MRIKPFGVFLLIVLIAGAMYGVFYFTGMLRGQTPAAPANPAQPNQPTQAQPANPGNPVLPGQPSLPGQVVTDGGYPVLVCDGSKSVLTVAFDSYAGFYPLVYRIMAMPASDHYCINLMPKWYGPDYDQNGLSEAEIEMQLKSGAIDIYFASNGAAALYDANSATIVWSTDQSAGADAIIARNSISMTGKNPTFNDIFERTILVSKGSADHYFALKMAQTVGFTPDVVNFQFSDSPVKDFLAGQGELVTYWDPPIRDAMLPDTTVLVSTKYWRTISDYVLVSPNADATKQDAIVYFLNDYNLATEAFVKENVATTAALLVNFQFKGVDMADWLWLDKSDPAGSLNSLLDGVAIAKLNDNVTMFEKDPFGSNKVKDQMIKTHNTWLFGQVYDNGNPGALFNADISVSDKYVKILLQGGAKQVTGDFNNKYDTDVSQTPPAVDSNTLIELPELLTLPYKNIKFVPNFSNKLVEGEEAHLLELMQPIANLMAESDDSIIVIRGGSGNYTTDPNELKSTVKFAFNRSLYIRSLLSEKLGIPIQRIILDPNVLLPDHYPSTKVDPKTGLSEMDNYVVVIISVKNSGNLK